MTDAEEIGILKDQIEELTKQIEKMKTCLNCKHWLSGAYCECIFECKGNRDKWELSE